MCPYSSGLFSRFSFSVVSTINFLVVFPVNRWCHRQLNLNLGTKEIKQYGLCAAPARALAPVTQSNGRTSIVSEVLPRVVVTGYNSWAIVSMMRAVLKDRRWFYKPVRVLADISV